MKSLLSQAFFVPDVHPRPRKHLSRCTLDCGFKTSESPALRGFVGERCPIRGTSLYLVLKSNGFRHSKKLPEKFGFSPIDTPANIAKKLPSQRCFKPLLIALFNFSHKRLTFALTPESGYTLGLRRKIAHKGLHAETGAFRTGVVSLPSERSARFGNPAWPGIRTANFAAFGPWSGVLSKNTESLRNSDALMRVAVPKASRPRWAAQLYLFIGVFTFVKDLAGCCQYSSPITKDAADSNIRIGTLSGHDQNTPRRSKIQKLNAMRQHIRVLQCMALRLSG